MDRNAWLRQDLPIDRVGIEIGPLARPIVTRPAADIRYADHLSQAGLRAKYAAHPLVDTSLIPEIDYVIGESGLQAAVGGDRFHYVIASHVIEHLPNPIGWLRDVHSMLVDGGLVVLAIPDMRQCFDALRRRSTAGEWVGAYVEKHSRPSASRIFDAMSNEVTVGGVISWVHHPDALDMIRSRTPEHSLDITLRNHESQEYFDVHCWAFTPSSFFNLMRTVVDAGLLQLELVDHRNTEGDEFLVKLRRNDSASRTDLIASYPAAEERFDRLPKGFDARVYYAKNPDVRAAGVDPYEHYLQHGWREDRQFC